MIERYNKYKDEKGRLFIVVDIRHDYDEKKKQLYPVRYQLLDVAKETTVFVSVEDMNRYIEKKLFVKL